MHHDPLYLESSGELSAGFLRQRRNLILISLVLPLFIFGEANLERLNIFGSTMAVNNPSAIYVVIITIFVYFFFRYWQYGNNERGMGLYRNTLSKYIYDFEFAYFVKLVNPVASVFDCDPCYFQFSDFARKEYREKYFLPKITEDAKVDFLHRNRLMQIHGVGHKYEQYFLEKYHGRALLTEDEARNIEKYWKRIEKLQGGSDARAEPIFETAVKYNVFLIKYLRLKSYVSFVVNRPDFTDYKLPIYLAAISFVSSVVRLLCF